MTKIALPMLTLALAGIALSACGEEAFDPSEEVQTETSALTTTALTLVNGWTRASGPFPYPQNGPADASVTLVSGVVQLHGALQGGTSPTAFTLPSGYRPSANVYLPVAMCNATKGRLVVAPTGVASIYGESTYASTCMVSLEGASFPVSTAGYTALTLQNGWMGAPYSTRNAAVTLMPGAARLVRLAGAITTTGTNASPFTIPLNWRPSTDVYVPVDLCNAHKGRLRITPAGAVTVVAEGGTFSNAACFTSLEGVSYSTTPASPGSFSCMSGNIGWWTPAPYSTRNLCLINDGGIIRLMGALTTTTANSFIAQLSTPWWPTHDSYLEVDLCNGEQGRLRILRDGEMNIEAEHGLAQAECFTSLEGVSYVQ